MFVKNPLDFVDKSRTLRNEKLSKACKLSNLCVSGIGGKNATNSVGPLATAKTLTIVPKQCAKRISIA